MLIALSSIGAEVRVSVTTDTNGVLKAPTNFFQANSALVQPMIETALAQQNTNVIWPTAGTGTTAITNGHVVSISSDVTASLLSTASNAAYNAAAALAVTLSQNGSNYANTLSANSTNESTRAATAATNGLGTAAFHPSTDYISTNNEVRPGIRVALTNQLNKLGGDGSLLFGDDEIYGSSWNGSTRFPTKNSVYDEIQTILLSAGSGDVLGPASSVNGNLPSFIGTTGKTIQDSGVQANLVVTNNYKPAINLTNVNNTFNGAFNGTFFFGSVGSIDGETATFGTASIAFGSGTSQIIADQISGDLSGSTGYPASAVTGAGNITGGTGVTITGGTSAALGSVQIVVTNLQPSQVSNLISLLAATNGLVKMSSGGSTNQYLNTPTIRYPVGTNLDVYADTFGFQRGSINVFGISNQTDGAQINVFGVSTDAAAIFHLQSPQFNSVSNTMAMDIGVWNTNFGNVYSTGAGIDLYNTNAANLLGPDFFISTTGRLPGDSGVHSHPIVLIKAAAEQFTLNYHTNDSSQPVPGFVFDARRGVLPYFNVATNNASGSGTVTASGNSRAIAGTSTKFGDTIFDEAGFGDMISVGSGAAVHIKNVASATSVTTMDYISPGYTGSNYSIYKAPVKWRDINGNVVAAICADGIPLTRYSGAAVVNAYVGGAVDWGTFINGSGTYHLYNLTANSTPLVLDSSGNLTLGSGIVGTTAAGNATAGNMGEIISSLVASGSAQALNTAVATNITSISLTAGDWDVEGNVNFTATTATITATSAGVGTSSNSIPTDGSEVYSGITPTTTTEINSITMPRKRVNTSITTNVFLVGKCTFSAGTVSAFGTINARRVR